MDNQDRLSELPDSLIHLILSFLPMRDVVSTTLLSKAWNNIWTTVPCLNFRNICRPLICFDIYNNPERERIRKFVNEALKLWKGTKILKFEIDTYPHPMSLAGDMDPWIHFAAENKVEELNMHFYWEVRDAYKPPQCLNSCSSLKKLSLMGCSLQINGPPAWNQLKSLVIHDWCMVGSDSRFSEELINQILLGTPQLVVFDLRLRDSDDNLNIQSTSLKYLTIDRYICNTGDEPSFDTMLRICCPNLETLQVLGVLYCRCLFTNVSSLTDVTLGFDELSDYLTHDEANEFLEEALRQILPSMQHVEKVMLSSWFVEVLGVSLKKYLLSPLPNVKFLKLDVYRMELGDIINLLGIFPNLKMLVIEETYNPPEFSSENFEFETNLLSKSFLGKMKAIDITSYVHHASMFQLIEILLKHAVMLEKMVIRAKSIMSRPQSFLFKVTEKLLSMPRSSPTAKVIFKTS